jgi:hypothetical protein
MAEFCHAPPALGMPLAAPHCKFLPEHGMANHLKQRSRVRRRGEPGVLRAVADELGITTPKPRRRKGPNRVAVPKRGTTS